jgi:hypothetical protein
MIRFTAHAIEQIGERQIEHEWIEATISGPDWTMTDPNFADRTRSYRSIPGSGDRILRVVHTPSGDDIMVITAHFDRGARRRRST